MSPTIVFLVTIVNVVLSLTISITKQKKGLLWGFRSIISTVLIYLAFLFLLLGAVIFKGVLLRSFVFGAIAGGIVQHLVTDPYLLKKTLSYNKTLTGTTPIWMGLLWTIVLTQLMYFAHMFKNPLTRGLFVVGGGSLYFYTCELVTGNLVHWWERRNCKHHLGVADYAVIAEVITTVVVLVFSLIVFKASIPAVVVMGFIGGLAIAGAFMGLCEKYFEI